MLVLVLFLIFCSYEFSVIIIVYCYNDFIKFIENISKRCKFVWLCNIVEIFS